MREILFRGKRIDNDEWVIGSLAAEYYKKHGVMMIAPSEDVIFKVDPDTIGQYTGLTDKNGEKIFEGDIIFDPEMKENHIVEFDEGGFCAGDMFLQAYISFDEFDSEVIGNIHDNSELLEVNV